VRELLIAWPLSFVVGVVVGLFLSSRWRIIKRPQRELQQPDEPQGPA